MSSKNQNVAVAVFDSEDLADRAVEALETWEKANKDVDLGTIGIMTRKDGKVKTKVGHKAGKGAKAGVVLGLIAGVLSGGITLVGGAVGGAVLGSVLGAFFKKSLHLTKDEIESLGKQLDAGKAAVIVTCNDAELAGAGKQLKTAGGILTTYAVPQEALEEAAQTLGEAPGESA